MEKNMELPYFCFPLFRQLAAKAPQNGGMKEAILVSALTSHSMRFTFKTWEAGFVVRHSMREAGVIQILSFKGTCVSEMHFQMVIKNIFGFW